MAIRPGRRPQIIARRDNATLLADGFDGSTIDRTWIVTDAGSALTVSEGRLRCPVSTTATVASVTHPRRVGLTFEYEITPTANNAVVQAGWCTAAGAAKHAAYFHQTGVVNVNSDVYLTLPYTYASGTSYRVRVVLRATGALYYISTDSGNTWSLLWVDTTGTTDPLSATYLASTAAWSSASARVYLGVAKLAIVNVASVAAITPTLGAELLTNGTFAAWTGDNPDNWIVGVEDANNYVTEAAGKARLVSNASYSGIRQGTLTTNQWYLVRVDVVTVVSGSLRVTQYGLVDYGTYSTTGMTTDVFRATGTNALQLQLQNPGDLTIDDASLKVITLSSCLGSDGGDFGVSDYVASINPTLTAGTQYGMMLNVDDNTNPANFILAYHDGTNAQLLKCVAGTYTSLISAAATYSAGATLAVVKIGTSVALYYNSAKIGATQTVSDAGVIGNTKHYPFSTLAGNSATNFTIDGA